MSIRTKICGIKTPEMLNASVAAGARFIGFVFFPPSPRHVAIDTAKELSLMLPTGVRGVGLFVDPSDEELEAVLGRVQLDMMQLHGTESTARVAEIKEKFAMPIIKAFPVSDKSDLDIVSEYEPHIDWILFDAKPPKGADVPGGMGRCFDWSIIEGRCFSKPWMLSGGLTSDNVKDALGVLSPDAVDVSSGVEKIRGEKDLNKIKAFIGAVNAL
ncbi:MAG: phosphoribosylanthranilate isomerase [Alphaproteobacteria bacterium]